MHNEIKLVTRTHKAEPAKLFDHLGVAKAKETLRFHESFPQYKATPLAVLDGLANVLGLEQIYVKDESHRFGLNAFKVLGGSYAVGQVIAEMVGLSAEHISFSELVHLAHTQLGKLTLITATDGNHGRGIAWTAATLGQEAVVYMPRGSSLERLENIRQTGATAEITDLGYDDTVRLARKMAEEKGWVLVQDTAWAGYEKIPTWIMQGYLTMAYETYRQIATCGSEKPTHIFLQAGVGSMAAAVAGFFAQAYGSEKPMIIIVEPNQADCLFRTAMANDGKLHCVTEDMNTIMAGLACGEPSPIAWDVLSECADAFISCPDQISAKGMRVLGNPVATDQKVTSGESGAVGIGLITELMTKPSLSSIREQLKLGPRSRVLCFSTEGDTDRAAYRSIVWDGAYPTF